MAETRQARWILVQVTVGALVSLTAGILARHQPRSKGYFRLFFSDPVHLKAGFATAAVILACFQLFTAAWIFRKLPWPKPAWVTKPEKLTPCQPPSRRPTAARSSCTRPEIRTACP